MEAQACSKPCIATKHAGISEVVIDKETGFLTKERDINSIANKMKLLYNDENLRRQMGKNALTHIHQEFNQTIQMQRLVDIYNELLKKYDN